MQYDFSNVDDDRDEFVLVPDGIYAVRIAETRESRGRDGSEHWGLRLEVLDGDCVGKTAAWDWLVWSERGIPRIKRILRALGMEVGGVIDICPQDLVGLKACVQVGVEEREDAHTGRRTIRNKVPYEGYAPYEIGGLGEIREIGDVGGSSEAGDVHGSNGKADLALS